MSENAEAVTKAAKKATKKAAKTARKAPAKKRPAKKAASKPTPVARKTRGRPAGKKTAKKVARKSTNGRRTKRSKQYAYMLLTPQESGEMKAGSINGPFGTEKDALDDASIMADDTMEVVLFREMKRGKVQKSTKFVAGR